MKHPHHYFVLDLELGTQLFKDSMYTQVLMSTDACVCLCVCMHMSASACVLASVCISQHVRPDQIMLYSINTNSLQFLVYQYKETLA